MKFTSAVGFLTTLVVSSSLVAATPLPQAPPNNVALVDTTVQGGVSAEFRGDCTFYEAGLGSCGKQNAGTDLIAALNAPQYGDSPNGNSNLNQNCNKCAEVCNVNDPSKSVKVTIVDRCPECLHGSLDLSRAAFSRLADYSTGRIQIKWKFVPC